MREKEDFRVQLGVQRFAVLSVHAIRILWVAQTAITILIDPDDRPPLPYISKTILILTYLFAQVGNSLVYLRYQFITGSF